MTDKPGATASEANPWLPTAAAMVALAGHLGASITYSNLAWGSSSSSLQSF
jgi:hypothetical protein